MTFDDGILIIYQKENIAPKGDMPDYRLKEDKRFYFNFDTLGLQRYYESLKADDVVESVVSIYQDRSITSDEVVLLEDGKQYRITLVQHSTDESGIKITRLSLRNMEKTYDYI